MGPHWRKQPMPSSKGNHGAEQQQCRATARPARLPAVSQRMSAVKKPRDAGNWPKKSSVLTQDKADHRFLASSAATPRGVLAAGG